MSGRKHSNSGRKKAMQNQARRSVSDSIQNAASGISPQRKLLFSLILFILPLLLLVTLEFGLRLIQYDGNQSLFISAGQEYQNFYMVNPNVATRFFFNQSLIPDPTNDFFLKKKPSNGYRIFVLGGSTAAGYPYTNNLMFSRILNQRLSDAFPDRKIEVVNTAMSAVNSYTLLDFMDEILRQEPDMLLIYAGHNEFYGALGVASHESLGHVGGLIRLYLKLERFKTFLLIRDLTSGIQNLFNDRSEETPSATLMEKMVKKQNIPLGSPLYNAGAEQFRQNLEDILKKAHDAGIPVLVSDLVSNVRNQPPFLSAVDGTRLTADSVFNRARRFDESGDFSEAHREYYRAKDLDALRFRATEEFNDIIHEVAGKYDNPVVPMKAIFENNSPNGIIGNNLILEHLHPNVDGYFLMSDAFFTAIKEKGYITDNWEQLHLKSPEFYINNWGFTPLDTAFANLRIKILRGGWPFQKKSAPNKLLHDYQPQTLVDSIAFKIWLNPEYTMQHGHVELAQIYERQGNFDLAVGEYKALMCLTPYNASPFLHAGRILVHAKQFDEAMPFLMESWKREKTAYAAKWIGQILLFKKNTVESIPFLEKAKQLSKPDPQLLYNLGGAYAVNAQYQEARKILAELDRIQPDFPNSQQLEQLIAKKTGTDFIKEDNPATMK